MQTKNIKLKLLRPAKYNPRKISKKRLQDLQEQLKPKSKPGEIYKLGPHRLMCGDSTDPKQVAKLMGGEKARLVFTDPPYNVDYDNSKYTDGRKMKWRKIHNDNLSAGKFMEFITSSLKNAHEHATDDASIYCFCGYTTLPQFVSALEASGWTFRQQIIWLKERFVLSFGSTFHRTYEPILYGWKKNQTRKVNFSINNVSDFWNLSKTEFKNLLDIWHEKRDVPKEYQHPTQKPVRLSMRAMALSTDHGDIVLDLFGGLGSTLMGAEKAGRRAFLMELDPAYCDVIRNRYAQKDKKKAKK